MTREDLGCCLEVDEESVPGVYAHSFHERGQWGRLVNVEEAFRGPIYQDTFDREGDKPLCLSFKDSTIYRIRIRGSMKHMSPKVPGKGAFKVIIDKIPYMKELGVTTVELLPVMGFQEVMIPSGVDDDPYGAVEPMGKINYWGYIGGHHFTSKASYSSGHGKHPIQKSKQSIKELHRAGMELVIELYFNGGERPAFVLGVTRL